MIQPPQPLSKEQLFTLDPAGAPVTNKLPGELRNFCFLLQPNFSMMALTSAIDALRTANLLSEEELYTFRLVSLDGAAVCSDLGFSAMADQALEELNFDHLDAFVVCGGLRVELQTPPKIIRFLRQPELRKKTLGSLWNGLFALAHAGVINDKKAVVHRSNRASFRETFADINLKDKAYVIDRQCFSCAGGNSALDMMLELMLEARGKPFVRGICDILTCDRISDTGEPAFLSDQADTQLPKSLQDTICLMQNNMEEMLSAEEIASLVGITRRQIERQFQRYLGSTPTRYYLELRLKRCHQLLTQTQLSMSDISLACGFVSYPHFSKCYRQYFEVTPSHTRRQS
ncbi:MAG TPA: AraC family transcriptional regulator [Oceanospirillaceae bacterium]|nr:AraC family transcriptional regulator [Oceanospirillaceae bacterium]